MIAATILAAGDSRRHPKQLVPCRGTTLIKAIACEVCASTCEQAAVVLGAHADLIAPELAGIAIAPLANPPWATHVTSQLRVAVDWARDRGASALAIVGCDQPRITAKHLERL
jgi:CTP:molybdopterin cytidylyltransferase MocA